MPTNIRKIRRTDLVYPELCYQILGILFEVWKNVGFGHQEKVYQRASIAAFKEAGLFVEEQLPVVLMYKRSKVGVYYFDFLIENRIVVELKVRNYFSKKDIDQLFAYLKAKDLRLGLIIHFTKTGVKFKRVVNLK